MKYHFFTLIFIACIFAGTSACTLSPMPSSPQTNNITKSIKFSGQVSRGETFEQEVTPNLTFRLVYYDGDGEGRKIWIADKANPDNDFSRYVTPPFYGFNGTIIEGWHFRNGDNTGPRDPNDLSVSQEIRKFYFVLNEMDHKAADASLEKILRDYNYSEEEVREAWETYERLNTGEGLLTITDLKLSNLIPGKFAHIESMEFDVEMQFRSIE